MPKTILTGLRANGDLTIGNYLGAILPMIQILEDLQPEDKFFLFVPDLHSFVTPIDHTQLYQNALNNVKFYLASGVNHNQDNVFLYRQSQIPAHSELAWILSCFGYYGELQRMIQFKEKAKQQKQTVSVGLFTYPILMAADILLYDADYVPVGEDQKQHLELTRDLAIRFNNKFGEVFVIPKPWSEQLEFTKRNEGVKIYSLTDPTKKMSKSITDPKGTILLTDDPELAAKKILGATTDTVGEINWDWEKQPGITNLLQIYSLLKGVSKQETIATWQGQTQYKDLKLAVAELVKSFLSELQEKFAKISDTEAEAILTQGASKAAVIAQKTLTRVQKVVGLIR